MVQSTVQVLASRTRYRYWWRSTRSRDSALGFLHQLKRISPGSKGTAFTSCGGGSAGFVVAGSAATVVADTTAEGGPSPAELVAITRTVYGVPLVKPVMVWAVVVPLETTYCRASVAASAKVCVPDFHCTL